MAKYVLLGDVHAADRAPSSCTERYRYDVLELLRHVMGDATSYAAEAVIIAGDLFHSKAPSRTSHKLVLEVLRCLDPAGKHPQAIVVPGNHDMQNDRLDSVDETQPLGVLAVNGAVELLEGWHRALPIYGVPWLQRWTDEAVWEVLEGYRGPSHQTLVVTHAPLYPPGKELPYENYPAAKFAEAMGNQGSVFYGHVHEPHGVYEVGGVTFCNNGALSRGSLHEYNLSREVGYTIWDSEAGRFDFVSLADIMAPAAELFRLEEHEERVDMQGRLDEFLQAVSTTSLGVVSIEAVMEHIRAIPELTPEELVLALELLEGVTAA